MCKITQNAIFFFLLATLLGLKTGYAQQCRVVFEGDAQSVELFGNYWGTTVKSCDSTFLEQRLGRKIAELQQQGYLLSAVSTLTKKDSDWHVGCFVGDKFRWSQLNIDLLPDELLSRTGYQKKQFENEVFSITKIKRFFERVIRESDNMGLPFAALSLDSVKINSNRISATLVYSPGPAITFDSLKISGNAKVKHSWLSAYLNLNYGQIFSQKTVDQIQSKIDRLGFLELKNPPEITFQNKKATVRLHLTPKKVSAIDGIVGFLPNEESQGSVLITGQFNLGLRNLFNSGKALDVQWQSLKARSQLLDMSYNHPNLFHSPLDFRVAFNLLKEDTFFINREAYAGFTYNRGVHTFAVFGEFQSSNLLSTEGLTERTTLPEVLDLNVDYYGAEYGFNRLNKRNSPTAGYSFHGRAAVGSKRLRRNADLPPELFDDIDLNTNQFKFSASIRNYVKIGKELVLFNRLRGGKIINDQLYLNDLFRIGGLNSLRGFNENFFFSSDYLLSNLELQLHFEDDSYLFAFYDQAYLYYNLTNSQFEDYPLGLGIGLNLSTNGGAVSIAYAVGQSQDQLLSLSLSKFHFGYVARF